MHRETKLSNLAALVGGLALCGMIVTIGAQPPAAPPATPAPGRGAVAGRGGGGNAGRFRNYPAEAVARGLTSYNTACGYCHGERGKGGKAGPDLIASLVTLHDTDGVQIAAYLKG